MQTVRSGYAMAHREACNPDRLLSRMGRAVADIRSDAAKRGLTIDESTVVVTVHVEAAADEEQQ